MKRDTEFVIYILKQKVDFILSKLRCNKNCIKARKSNKSKYDKNFLNADIKVLLLCSLSVQHELHFSSHEAAKHKR